MTGYEYDKASKLIKIPDALNRITSEEKKVTKTGITPTTDAVSHTYDSLGRVTSKSETGYNSYTVNLGYDAVGNIKTIRSADAVGGYNGRLIGDIADNITVNVHPSTTLGGTPTLELYYRDSGKSVKIRY